MKALHKVLIAIVLSMTAVFLGVGFANTTVDIEVAGTANILPPEAVYITSVTVNSTSGTATADEGTYLMTAHSSTLDLGSNKNSTVTYSITVYNNTGETYAYNAAKYIQDAYSNANVTFALTNPDGSAFKHGAEVEAGKSLTFNVTFSYNDKNSISDTALTSTINYEFLPLDELPEEEEIAVSGALEQFRKIINDLVFDGSYDDLIEQMDKAAANDRHDSSYIGNVTGASPDDSALLNDLFQGQLILNINGKEEPVTILIKRENLDGNVNTGDADGAEVIQLYIRDLVGSTVRPVKELKAFDKVFLAAGESREVTLRLPASALAFHDAAMNRIVEPGKFKLWVGECCTDERYEFDFKII